LMISAALLFTGMNLIIKLLNPEFNIWHIGFYRFFGGAVVILAIFWRKSNPYKGNNMRLLFIRGCIGSVAFISLISAVRSIPVSTALVIFYSFPAFAAVAAFIFYKERIGKWEILCIAIVILGVGILFDFQLVGSFFGQTMALIGGVFAGLTVTLIRSLRGKNGPVIIYLYFCTMGALVSFPMFVMNPLLPSSIIEWVMIIAIILSSVAAQLLMTQGFGYCRGWEGGVFMSSEVIFTAIMGIIFLGDPTSWRFWIGGLLIFSSVLALNRLKAK
ncbi:MAG: DMT family transporter, partial [Deltaproteobacteria bacterium]|nr:DMT family transporter [Deltaproteobacteria bacterium]